MNGNGNAVSYKVRRAAVYVIIGLLFAFLVLRLFDIQIKNHEKYKSLVDEEITVESKIKSQRGEIYDSEMKVLATNVSRWRVFISPEDIMHRDIVTLPDRLFFSFSAGCAHDAEKGIGCAEIISLRLADILGADSDEIAQKAAKKGRLDETIKKNADADEKAEVEDLIARYSLKRLVNLEEKTVRYYPGGSLAASVIGFVNSDGEGQTGLEYYYDDLLKGQDGLYIHAEDSLGNVMPSANETYVEAVNGNDLVLTLNSGLQKILDAKLEKCYLNTLPGNKVAGVVYNVKTGGILAMGTYPNFDLNEYSKLNDYYSAIFDSFGLEEGTDEYYEKQTELLAEMYSNKCLVPYEPGSTFKIITSSIALDVGAVTPYTEFDCAGVLNVYGTNIKCHLTWGHGHVTFRQGLQFSCNPTLMQTAALIGRDRFYDYYKAYGFLDMTGIDLPGESLFPTTFFAREDIGPVELAVASFGQRFKTSMVHMISAISAVANDGNMKKPHVLGTVRNNAGVSISTEDTSTVRQVVSEYTSDTINDILEESVFIIGANPSCHVKGYRVCGKTGTSQIFDKLDADGNDYLRLGSAVIFAPADDPEIAILLTCDEPSTENTYGSYVAAPYAAEFMDEALKYLGYEPSYTAQELANLETSVGNYIGLGREEALEKAKSLGFEPEILGDGDRVIYQTPSGGSPVTGGYIRLVLYTGSALPQNTVAVPDVKGRTTASAGRLLVNAGLSVLVTGSSDAGTAEAVVAEQTPAAGEFVSKGTVINIVMRYKDNAD